MLDDRWNVLLGLAVIALTGVSARGWIEHRTLQERVSRLERGASEGGTSVAATASRNDEPEFMNLNATISLRDAAFIGDPDAAIVIVEFSDFQCPFCARHFSDTFKRIKQRYVANGTVKYVFRHLPLEEIHPQAFRAAEVAECSRRQGLFWEVHDRLFERQRLLQASDMRQLAVDAGADRARLDDCLRDDAAALVRRDVADAGGLGVAGTPLFFIGRATSADAIAATRSISGARPFEVFVNALEGLIP